MDTLTERQEHGRASKENPNLRTGGVSEEVIGDHVAEVESILILL